MFRKLDFQKKLFISFSLILLIVLFLSGYIFVNYNTSLLKQNIETSSMDSLISIQNQLDDDLAGMDQMLKAVHSASEFTNLVFSIEEGDPNYFARHPLETDLAHSILISYLTARNVNSTFIYVSQYYDSLRISNSSHKTRLLPKQSIAVLPQIKEGLSTDEYQLYYPPHMNPWSAVSESVYSVVRPIRDTFHTYGVLEYQKNTEDLNELIENAAVTDIQQFSIMGGDGEVYYTYSDSGENAILDPKLTEKVISNKKGLYYLDNYTLLCYIRSPLTGWSLIIERDITPPLSDISRFSLIIYISYFLALCILLLFLYIITRNLARPLRTLKDNLSVLEMDQDIHLPMASGNNEVTILTAAIEEILNKLRLQNTLLITARKRAMQAHFEAMEAQLNPHFLYNTLSVIGACGLESGSRTVPKMCAELSNLLRYSITYTHKNVLLRNEIKNIQSYLYIMKIRYEQMLDYTWEIDETLLDLEVPKLIFQPIVENCFQHGFSDTPPPWHIKIKISQDGTNWHGAFSNNGTPFAIDKMEYLENRLQYYKDHMHEEQEADFASGKTGFGLENTILRLYIYYKGLETFQVYREPPDYTTIEIGGPLK